MPEAACKRPWKSKPRHPECIADSLYDKKYAVPPDSSPSASSQTGARRRTQGVAGNGRNAGRAALLSEIPMAQPVATSIEDYEKMRNWGLDKYWVQ